MTRGLLKLKIFLHEFLINLFPANVRYVMGKW